MKLHMLLHDTLAGTFRIGPGQLDSLDSFHWTAAGAGARVSAAWDDTPDPVKLRQWNTELDRMRAIGARGLKGLACGAR